MRIISQGGNTDLPYEEIALCINCDDIIATHNNKEHLMARYSTMDKAKKAMEMLREQYSRLQVVKILASGTCEHMEKSLSKDEFLECNLKYREMNIFQFPKDEDVEV